MNSKNRGWFRVLLIIVPYIIIVGLFQLMGMILSNTVHLRADDILTTKQHLIMAFCDMLGVFLLVWLFIKYLDKEKFINLGFHIKNRLNEIVVGILIGVLIMGIGFFFLLYTNEIIFEDIVFDYKELTISILLFLLAATSEEVLFRGYILKNLMISFNSYIALLISSLLFALIHLANPNIDLLGFLDLVLAGMFLGVSYIFTKNLWFPIALHFSWNLFQTLFGFNVSGQNFYSLIEFRIAKVNNLLNGGDFGFEGSILAIIAQILVILIIWGYYRNRVILLDGGDS